MFSLSFLAVCLTLAQQPVIFTNARIHPVDRPVIERGTLLVRGGKIAALGPVGSMAIPADARVIDCEGKVIIPGLVDTHSHLGIFSRPGITANSDGNEGSGPIQPSLRAMDAVTPDDPGIRMALAGGLTTVNIMPGSGNAIGGQTVYVKLRGNTIEEMRVEAQGVEGGLKMANGENPKNFNFTRNKTAPATRMKTHALQREQFLKAREYQAKWADHEKKKAENPKATPPDRDLAMEPLVEVLERKRTVHFHCHRADDLMSALRLAREFNFEIVLQHASEGHRVAEELAALKANVSLTLLEAPGGKAEVVQLIEENAAALVKAGVRVAINTDDPVTESRFYLRTGAIAVRGGLTEAEALRALTLNPAIMLHLDHRLGSLTPGKDADFALLSGSPFSIYTQVLETWIEGVPRFQRDRAEDARHQAGGYALATSDKRWPGVTAPAAPPSVVTAPMVAGPAKGPLPARFAVRAGRLFNGKSFIINAVVVVNQGKIEAVGPASQVPVPPGIPVITAAEVTPGLIDAHGCGGISGGLNVPADQDQDEGTDPNQAEIRVLDAFNPDDGLLEFLRRQGVTVVHTTPGRKNAIAGQSAIFRTHGRTAEGMLLRSPAMLVVNLGESAKEAYSGKITTRMGVAALLRQALQQGKTQAEKPVDKDKPAPANPKTDALAAAASGKLPVLIAAHRADDIMTALRLRKEFGLDLKLALGTEAYLVLDEVKAAGVPVFLHPPMQRLAASMETIHSFSGSPRVLRLAGIPFALGSAFEGYVPKIRNVRSEAAMAAAQGLSREDALASVTHEAAKLLGISAERGAITPGRMADLVLYNGDPLESSTHVTHTLLEGRQVYSRAEYLELPLNRRGLSLSGSGGAGCCLGW
ncbi:MAG: amidohydrolase [Planctomycetota bacterium]|nr:MAG: amidohydrolase [Planctomycetota bacterium]